MLQNSGHRNAGKLVLCFCRGAPRGQKLAANAPPPDAPEGFAYQVLEAIRFSMTTRTPHSTHARARAAE
eukprot:1296250-Pyramimonas_sp.AAC.1